MKPLQHIGILVFVTALFFFSESIFFASGQRSSIYSAKEIAAIKKFRPTVAKWLTLDYHKKDGYLLRWIRGNDFDLKKAAEALEKNHQWRKDNDIDSLHTQSLGANTKYLPCKVEGYDREGRPILFLPYGKWKVRNYVIAGKQADAIRHFRTCLEKSIRSIFERAEATGQDIDQYYAVTDMDGYNVRDNLCLGCVPLTVTLSAQFDSSSAFLAKNLTVVNSPRIFQPVLALIRNVWGLRSLKVLNDYDSDKKIWQPLLHRDIAPDQLPRSLGGTRPG